MGLNDKVAIISGGAGGIGRAIAELFIREEFIVVIVDQNLENSNSFKLESYTKKQRIYTFRADVSCKKDIEEVVYECMQKFGRIDILVNNAAIMQIMPLMSITEEQWDKIMAVNLKSVLFFSQAVVPYMKDIGQGTIVNIASIAGKQGGLLVGAHYAVSKAGVICLTKCLARELAQYNIRVNAVCPGITDTHMSSLFSKEQVSEVVGDIPLKRMARPEEVAQAVLFLVTESSSYITGEILDVNGGSLMD